MLNYHQWGLATISCGQILQEIAQPSITKISLKITNFIQILLLRSDAVASLLTNGNAAFKWKLHCHWLIGWWQRQIAVVRQGAGPNEQSLLWCYPVTFEGVHMVYVSFSISQGCSGRLDPFTGTRPPWSAKRSEDYGYARMTVMNGTHLYLEQVSDDKVRN